MESTSLSLFFNTYKKTVLQKQRFGFVYHGTFSISTQTINAKVRTTVPKGGREEEGKKNRRENKIYVFLLLFVLFSFVLSRSRETHL